MTLNALVKKNLHFIIREGCHFKVVSREMLCAHSALGGSAGSAGRGAEEELQVAQAENKIDGSGQGQGARGEMGFKTA